MLDEILAMNEHYRAVLADLQRRRSALEAEIAEIDLAIGPLRRLAFPSPESHPAPPYSVVSGQAVVVAPLAPGVAVSKPQLQLGNRYAGLSVRWAVLWHLAEVADGYMRTGEITQAIKDGGYHTDSSHFGNAVSAVLSGMRAKGELEASEDGSGYRISDAGRSTWSLIKQEPKFRSVTSTASLPLSVQ